MKQLALIGLLVAACAVNFPDGRFSCRDDADCGGDGYRCFAGGCCNPDLETCSSSAGGGSGGGGTVDCGAGFTACGSACVNTVEDRNHCGVCGNACPGSWPCAQGGCQAAPTDNPFLAAVTPPTATVGTMVTLQLTGERFTTGALVRLSGGSLDVEKPLMLASDAAASVAIDTTAARPGTIEVQVVNPGRLISNTRTFSLTGVGVTPMLTSVVPSMVPAEYRGPATISGANFDGQSQLRLSGGGLAAPRDFTAVFVSPSQLYLASLNLSGIAQGTYSASVAWPGGMTTPVPFTISGTTPAVTGVSPNRAPRGSMVTITVDGSSFDATSRVRLAAAGAQPTAVTTVLVSATRLSAGPVDLTSFALGNYALTVQNNGAFDSNAVGFVVLSNDPTLVSVSPAGARQDLTVNLALSGANFLSGAAASISSAMLAEMPLTTTFADAGTLTVSALALGGYAIGPYQLRVRNPGSAPSASVSFTVTEGQPALTQASPTSFSVSASQPVSATLTGTFLYASSVVHISGGGITDSPLPTTWLSPTSLRVTQDISGQATGAYTIWVVNPATPAPLVSNTLQVTLTP